MTVNPVDLTATEASARIADNRLSSEGLTRACLDRLRQLDGKLLAWETVCEEDALETARELDQEYERSGVRGPIHGIPVGLKDIYYTAGMRTTMSSRIYDNFVPDYDAESVVRLKRAGAVIIGKTVTTEFATGDPPPTLNPWNPDHTPGGSSSGSAVAVATRMCPVATGSQTAGSVNRPAAYNGVIGFKPTYGRVSRWGVFPVSWTLDTLGWFTRSVEDSAAILDAVSGFDPRDPASTNLPPTESDEMMESWEEPPTIGIVDGFFEDSASTEVKAETLRVVDVLRSRGATFELFALPDSFNSICDAQLAIEYTECAAVHREVFEHRSEDYAPEIRSRIESGTLIPGQLYIQAQRLRRRFRRDIDEAFGELDVLITPATPTPAPAGLATTGDPVFQSPWTTAGLPVINLPTGLNAQYLPLAVQLIGHGFGEAKLLRAARWVEKVAGVDLMPSVIAQD